MNNADIQFEITELHRRLANMIQLGKIVETDYSQEIPKARIEIGEIKTTWLPMLVQRAGNDASAWLLEIDEQVLVFSQSGDTAQGIILGSINQQAIPTVSDNADIHRTQYSDGATIEYDRSAHFLKAILPSGAKTELISDGGVSITGDVTVTGSVKVSANIKADGNITDHTRSMQQDRNLYNSHTHGGVSKGIDDTLLPNEQQ